MSADDKDIGVHAELLREVFGTAHYTDVVRVAAAIKSLPLRLTAPRPLDEHLMLKALPGVFCAGEMLDWEAPTGGYLLTACFASGPGRCAG